MEIGRQAKACTCIGDSVKIDVSVFEPHVINEDKGFSDEEGSMRKRKKKKRAMVSEERSSSGKVCGINL